MQYKMFVNKTKSTLVKTKSINNKMLEKKSSSSGFLAMALTALRLSSDKLLAKKNEDQNKSLFIEISLKEVSLHDAIDDCWIVIYDRVYNITNFLYEHPGGHDVLLEYAGRDASIAFRGAGHSRRAIVSLNDFQIGQLPKEECIYRCEGLLRFTGLPD